MDALIKYNNRGKKNIYKEMVILWSLYIKKKIVGVYLLISGTVCNVCWARQEEEKEKCFVNRASARKCKAQLEN